MSENLDLGFLVVIVVFLISSLISTEVGNLFLRQKTVIETKYFLVSVSFTHCCIS